MRIRVRVNQGRGQLYGTQFNQKDGKLAPEPIEDESNVDKRRASVGMGTLAELIKGMNQRHPTETDG